MRHLTIAALGLVALGAAPRATLAQPPATCKVVYVLDGDTINCEGGVTVRLLLIDVPDEGDFGEQARAYVIGLVPKGSELRLVYDEKPRTNDGRWQAYVFLADGSFLNRLLVEKGFAYVAFSEANRERLQELRKAEQGARGQKMGLWSQ